MPHANSYSHVASLLFIPIFAANMSAFNENGRFISLGFYLDKAVLILISVFEAAGKVKTIDKTPSDFRLFENQLDFARNT